MNIGKKVFNRDAKGITLVALVITIIILLILAGVSIRALTGNEGLISRAKLTAEEARGASVEESVNLWRADRYMNNYVKKGATKPAKELLDELESQNLLKEDERRKLESGETLSIGSKNITLTLAELVEVGYYIDYGDKAQETTYTTKTEETGYESTQTFSTDKEMLWRVMDIKENGDVELLATSNITTNDATENKTGLYLKGQTGFLKGIDVLNNLCDTLYAVEGYSEARSINVDDIIRITGFNPETDNFDGRAGHGPSGLVVKFTSGGPLWNEKTNKFEIPSEDNPITLKSDQCHVEILRKDTILYDTLTNESKTGPDDWYSKSIRNLPMYFWLGSRYVNIWDTLQVYFGFNVFDISGYRDCPLFASQQNGEVGAGYRSFGVRCIVTLNSSAQVAESDSTGERGSQDSPIKLK